MATVKLMYRKNSPLKNGSFPLVIRLSHLNNPVMHIRIKGLSVSDPGEWNDELARFTKKKEDYKIHNKVLTDIESEVDDILTKLVSNNTFSYQKFKNIYLGNVVSDLVFETFDQKIKDLISLKKFGTCDAYTSSMKALKKFTNNKGLIFSDIDFLFLTNFEKHLRLKGNCGNTISYKVRSLRALHYNYCNTADKPLPSAYRKFKVGRLATVTAKRSLTGDELKLFMEYDPTMKQEQLVKDIFIFSLLTRGMNIADMASLKPSNIIDGGSRIAYRRSKTGGLFSIAITQDMQNILNRINTKGKFLFPIIKPHHKNIRHSVWLFTRFMNSHLKTISSNLKIPKITTYWARHTFAQLCRDSGASIEIISKLLGHRDLKTTEIYLRSFSDEKLDDFAEDIFSNFKK